jgi:hypothetical protein
MNSVLEDQSPADGYYDTAQWSRYTCPATVNNGQWCNPTSTRGSMIGPGYQNVDFSIQKKFKITEQVNLALMGNFFNLFNHTNFDIGTGTGLANQTSSSFGRPTAAFSPRITQLAFRLDF